jgi:predicted neuraminidase
LFYRVGAEPWASVAFLKRSYDNGEHWGEAELLPAGIVGPSKNKPLFLEDGTMLCPSSMQAGSAEMSRKATAVWIDISKDGAKTWVKSGPLAIEGQPFGAIEPAIFWDGEGNIRMLCRDRALRVGKKDGHIWTSVSSDKGKTWSPLEKTDLPNPDSAFDAVDLGQDKIVLIYNHSQTARHPLSLAVSTDGGKSWEKKMDLEETTGEFPAAILSTDGTIHVIYAYEIQTGQRRIKHLTIESKPLFQNDTPSTIR